MPLILGDINLFAELRLLRQDGTSHPVKERHCEVTDVADTWTCTTWIDLEGEDDEQVEYSLHWEDRNPYTRASKGRLVVDGEPVGTRYVDPSQNQVANMIDYHRMDEEHCARLEFARIRTTEEVGPDVRRLGAMAGTVKLEIELGWFVEEKYRRTEFKQIDPHHPLFDARPVSSLDTASHAGLTHTSKFGKIFKKPFHLPYQVERRGTSRKFMANPPPFRNGVPGMSAKRPFAEFFWIVGMPDHLPPAQPDPNSVPSPLAQDLDPYNPYSPYPDIAQNPPVQSRPRTTLSQTPFDRSPSPAAASASNPNWGTSIKGRAARSESVQAQADPRSASQGTPSIASGSGSGSGTSVSKATNGGAGAVGPAPIKEEQDIKPNLAPTSTWSNTRSTQIDLTFEDSSDEDDDSDDEIEGLFMDSGVVRQSVPPAPVQRGPSSSLPPRSEAGGTGLYTAKEDWLAPASVPSSSPGKPAFTTTTTHSDFPPLPSAATSGATIPRPPSTVSSVASQARPGPIFADVARSAAATPTPTSAPPAQPSTSRPPPPQPRASASSSTTSAKRPAERPLIPSSVEDAVLKRPRTSTSTPQTFDLASASAWSSTTPIQPNPASHPRPNAPLTSTSTAGGGAEREWEDVRSRSRTTTLRREEKEEGELSEGPTGEGWEI